MVSFNPSTSLRSGSSSSDLSHFKTLQKTAKKDFGVFCIFRDNVPAAQSVIDVLQDLQEGGHNLSDISIIISKKLSIKKTRTRLGFKECDTPAIINEIFQSWKHLFSAEQQLETNPSNQEKLLDCLMLPGIATYTTVGKVQKPLVTIEPNYLDICNTEYSTERKDHTAYHELIHALHFKRILTEPPVQKEIRGFQRACQKVELVSAYCEEAFNSLVHLITQEVGTYAGTQFMEFVPEYWIFKRFNPSYANKELDELYRLLKGPEILPKPSKP